MSRPDRLIADIGGTNARFAMSDERGDIHHIWHDLTSAHASFEAALDAYLGRVQQHAAVASVVIAAAGPVLRGEIALTNSGWTVREDRLAARFGPSVRIGLVNDLEAVAHALPHLAPEHLSLIDVPLQPVSSRSRMLVVNVGTGFGSACLIRAGAGWVSCPAESGHMLFGALDAEELDFFQQIGVGAPTSEDVLSGEGVRRMASFFRENQDHRQVEGSQTADEGREPVTSDHFDLGDGSDAASTTVERLTAIMARACSNLTLASAAWDGLFICGSVASAWWRHADLATFRRLFAGQSKMRQLLEHTPVALITRDDPALLGLANFRFPEKSHAGGDGVAVERQNA